MNRTIRMMVDWSAPDFCGHQWKTWNVWPADLELWQSEICMKCGATFIDGVFEK